MGMEEKYEELWTEYLENGQGLTWLEFLHEVEVAQIKYTKDLDELP